MNSRTFRPRALLVGAILFGICFTHALAAPMMAATIAPVAQIIREAWPEAHVFCLAAGADPHAVQLSPARAARARRAQALFAAGALDGGWRPPHPHTVVLFDRAAHGWLDPAALAVAWQRLARAADTLGLPAPQRAEGKVQAELARWRALVQRHAPLAAICAHGAWCPWLAAAGVRPLAVLEAHEGTGTGARTLAAALRAARAFSGRILLVRPAKRPSAPLARLARLLGDKAIPAALPALGRCDEDWQARMTRARRRLAEALGE